MNGAERPVTLEKDIGFWMSEDLSSTTHVQKAKGKVLLEIIRIRKNFFYIDKKLFCILYNQRIWPHLDYSMAACLPSTSAEAVAGSDTIKGDDSGVWNEVKELGGEAKTAGIDVAAKKGEGGSRRGF